MKRLFNKNRILFILIVSTIICFILGILFHSIIDLESKSIVNNNILNLIENLNKDSISNLSNFNSLFFSNCFITFIIWVFGISIIGILLVYVLYLFKIFIYAFEFVSLFSYLKLNNILYIFIFYIPNIISMFILLFISYYSLSFSFRVFKHLFIDKSINIRKLFIGYLRVFFIALLLFLINSIIEIFIIPKLLLFLF
ncbi:MAG: stage II sporulation protein M [Bacilli bacterium]|nr:stage II sporulation protein M [Bacilli bacterium]